MWILAFFVGALFGMVLMAVLALQDKENDYNGRDHY